MEPHRERSCELVVIKETGDVFNAKGAAVLPGQTTIRFDAVPVVYKFEVQTIAGLSFEAVFTVGPPLVVTDHDSRLLLYADYISGHNPAPISELVPGIVQLECQALIAAAGAITMEYVKTQHFRQAILERVEPWLSQFGLMVYHFDFDVALGHAYFSNLVSYTDQVKQNILFIKVLKLSDLNHQLALPTRVFNHLLETSGATFKPEVGLTYAQGHLGSDDKYMLDFNVTDDWGIIRGLKCRVRKTGKHSKPEIVSEEWRQFVYDWNLQLGDFIIFYELFGHFTGISYKIGVVRMARIP